MYRYRKYQLNDEQTLLVRTEVHGYYNHNGKDELFNAYAVNEWCPRTPILNRWRNKLDSNVSIMMIILIINTYLSYFSLVMLLLKI